MSSTCRMPITLTKALLGCLLLSRYASGFLHATPVQRARAQHATEAPFTRALPRVNSLNFWFSMPSVIVHNEEDVEMEFNERFYREEPVALAEEHKIGVIVVDHGSRRADANNLLHKIVEDYKDVSGFDLVEPAHMELAEPSIASAFGKCVEQGATYIICHPFFLARGRHVQDDIPTLMEEAASIFPGVRWAISEPLGVQPDIPKLMHAAIGDCMSQNQVLPEQQL